jgi:hypothetical protein
MRFLAPVAVCPVYRVVRQSGAAAPPSGTRSAVVTASTPSQTKSTSVVAAGRKG